MSTVSLNVLLCKKVARRQGHKKIEQTFLDENEVLFSCKKV